MTRPYSLDLRDRVMAAVERDGLSRNQAAARFGVAVSTAVHWVRRYRTTGSVAPPKVGGYKKRALRDEHAAWLIARCQEKDFTISQLVEELLAVRGLKVDRHSVWEFLHTEHLSFKMRQLPQELGLQSRLNPTALAPCGAATTSSGWRRSRSAGARPAARW
jgi:putative transposase